VRALGVDYAGGTPDPWALTTAGYVFACRYLSSGGPALPGKLLTAPEYRALTAAGVSVAVNWETTATRMLSGYPAGVQDAKAAQTHLEAIGYPADTRPIYFSADFDATPGQQTQIDDYLRGCASVIGPGRVGIYGSYYVVQRCLNHGTARWAWQTMAWSGGQVDPRAHLVQRIGSVVVDGVECDVNEALRPDFGQHPTIPRRRESPVCYRLDPTPIPTGVTADALPEGTWPAVEDTITTPGPAGGWPGRVFVHLTFGYRGGYVQEAWSAPSGKHYVPRWDPTTKTGGQYIPAFTTQNWELPTADTALIVRYATRARGSVTPETQN
jgi:hypothetical protein